MSETAPKQTHESDDGLTREEVMLGLRKFAAVLALGGGLAALGTAAWVNHNANNLMENATTTSYHDVSADTTVVSEKTDQHAVAEANELISNRNILIGIGASGIGLAMMQGSIAKRTEAGKL